LPKSLSKHEIENYPSLLFHTHHFIFSQKIKDLNINPIHQIGDSIDELEDVEIFYNNSIRHIENQNITKDGYNLGLRWQCVEFVNHKMPDSYGHAKDFFDKNIEDGKLNKTRNLIQYSNPSLAKPQKYDILIFGKTNSNTFGHVAIISEVSDDELEIIQQNMVFFGNSREKMKLIFEEEKWGIKNPKIHGRLSKKK
jgi:hypothetical protein